MVELVTHLDKQVGTLLDHEFLPLILLICCLSSIGVKSSSMHVSWIE